MTRVSPTCSPLRSCSRNSIAVCAASIRAAGAAPGPGAKRQGAHVAQLAAGELEEHVLEAAPLDGQVLGQHALRARTRRSAWRAAAG